MRSPGRHSDSTWSRWQRKFACAVRGVIVGIRGQSSFLVHLPAAFVVVGWGIWLDVSRFEWLVLILCITVVLSAELLNSAIECLARAITKEENQTIRDALDVASGGVLLAASGAAIAGVLVLVIPLLARVFGG